MQILSSSAFFDLECIFDSSAFLTGVHILSASANFEFECIFLGREHFSTFLMILSLWIINKNIKNESK